MHQTATAVRHNPAQGRFEVVTEGATSLLAYTQTGNDIVMAHTEVPEKLQGQGIATELAHAALEYARAQGLKVVPQCPFVANYIRQHPEYAELLKQA